MELLKRLLEDTTVRALKSAQVITFWLDGEAFTLDPKQKQLVVAGAATRSALTVRTSPAVLVRLLTDPQMALGAGEELAFDGDPLALKPLVDALAGGKSPLMTRLGALAR